MPIELSKEHRLVLEQTGAATTPEEFEKLHQAALTHIRHIVREVMGPGQPVTTTLVELRDLYLLVHTHSDELDKVRYGAEKRGRFRDSIRLLDTAHLWFGEGARDGVYKVPSVETVVNNSRPWRARLKAFADQAFAYEPEIAAVFSDINSTGTLDEEVLDLRTLVREATNEKECLSEVGMPDEFLLKGQMLLREAEGRDLLGVLGLRNKDEAMFLRNTILTYAIRLGHEARAAGINAYYEHPEERRRFEAVSFRDALRRMRPRRQGASGGDADEPG
jgi:hypothetical protein